MLAPVSRCPSLPCSWLKGTKLCTIFGHHASNYVTILGRVRREQTGGDGRRGLVVARSGVGGGRVWTRLAPGSGRVAQPPWSRHHPVLTSGTWAHPHNHWFHDMWRSSLFLVTLKVPIIYSDKRTLNRKHSLSTVRKTLSDSKFWNFTANKSLTPSGDENIIWKWSLYTFLCISVVWVRRPGVTEAEGRSSHSHINVDIFSLLSIIIAILFVFDWQIIALCAETYFHFIFLFLPSICCMRSIVWNKCTAPVVSPPSTILHHHSWHFGIKSNVRSVLSLSHS